MAQQSTLEFLVAAQVTGQEQIARLINDTDKLNKTTKGLQSAFAQMGGAARSLSEVQKNAAAIDAARAEKIARLSQEFYNNALSIDRTAKSARDSASAFEEAFQAQEMAAQAQRDAAAAADALRAKLDPMIPIQNRFNAEMDRASDLLRMGAISQKEYAQATTMARQNLYSAQQALVGMEKAQSGVIVNGIRYNSMADYQSRVLRNQRQGAQQLGMQFNDLATSISTGANPIQAFNQQMGQMGYAMSMMEGKMGAVGAFLIGPWGTALQIGAMALGFLITKLMESDSVSQKAKASNYDFSQAVDFSALSVDKFGEALGQLNERTRAAIDVQESLSSALYKNAQMAQIEANRRLQAASQARKNIKDQMSGLAQFIPFVGPSIAEIRAAESEYIAAAKAANIANEAYTQATAAILQRGVNEKLDKRAAITRQYEDAVGALNRQYMSADPLIKITNAQYEQQYEVLTRTKDAALKLLEVRNKRERKPPMTDAMRDAKKLAEATARWTKAFPSEGVNKAGEVYEDYRIMMIKSTEASNKRMSELDDEMARNNIDRAAKMAKEIGYIVEDGNKQQAEQITKPYEALQNSFQAIGQTVSNAFKGMITGATSWKDAMRGIINSVIDQLWQLYVVQQIVGFVTKALGKVGAPLPGPVESVSPFMKAANGTINSPGGLTWVGERGPELLNLPKGSQVIPAHRAQSMGGGGININVDARGSADPAAVRAQVEQGILQAAPAIIAAAQQRTVTGLRRPKLGGVMQ